ncbi:MAG: hypothetical protein J0I07_22840 [Myxococcales bacterium]|nr:hypothetical protein [Myxococcales bacterium]
MGESWIVRADCAPWDVAEATALAVATLVRGGVVHRIDLERVGTPVVERRWNDLAADDATAIVRAELALGSKLTTSFGALLPSGRPIGLFLQALSGEYVKLYDSKPLQLYFDPPELVTPAEPSMGHTDFDALVLGLVGSGEGEARIPRAFCGLEGGTVPSVRDAYAAYYARDTDLATDLGVDASGADVVAALELAASEMPPHRRVNTRVTRLDDGGVLLSVTPFGQSRHTEKTLAPLLEGARQLLGR